MNDNDADEDDEMMDEGYDQFHDDGAGAALGQAISSSFLMDPKERARHRIKLDYGWKTLLRGMR